MRDVLLFSGGLDSLIAYFYLNNPLCLFVNMKQRYADVELNRVKQLQKQIGFDLIIDETTFNFSQFEREDLVIPNRNAFLAMLASNYGDNIWMAAVDGDYNHDKNPEIFKEMSRFCSKLKGTEVKVDSPFWDWTKTKMIEWYIKQGHSEEWLKLSYSCFKGTEKQCGRCPSCLRRWLGMFNNDIHEEYIEDPATWDVVDKYIERMIHGEKVSDTKGRREEFFRAMFKGNFYVPKTDVEWIEKLREEYKK